MSSHTATIFVKRNMFAALAVASVLLLTTGCAPELGIFGGGGTGGSGGTGSSDSDGSANSDPDGDNKSDEGADGKKDDMFATLVGKSCFPGNWIANNDDIKNYIESASGGATITSTGHITLTYNTDGTSQTNYDHWTNTIKLAGATSVVERHGIDKGTYTATDQGTFTASDTSIGSVTKMTASVPGGQKISMAVDPEPSVFDSGKYTCSGDLLTIVVDGFDLKLFREH